MKIAVAGFGLEGRSNYDYFRTKYPEAEMVIFDENPELGGVPEGAATVLGKGAGDRVRPGRAGRLRAVRRIGDAGLGAEHRGRRRQSLQPWPAGVR